MDNEVSLICTLVSIW